MQSSSTFIRISGPIPEVKKICIDCILGRIRAKRGLDEQVRFVSNTVEESVGWCNPRNILKY